MAGGASTISLDVERTHACDVQAKGQIRLRNIQHGSIAIGLVLDNGTRATDFLRQDLRVHVPLFNTKSIVLGTTDYVWFTEYVNLRRERPGYSFGAYKAWIIVCCLFMDNVEFRRRKRSSLGDLNSQGLDGHIWCVLC